MPPVQETFHRLNSWHVWKKGISSGMILLPVQTGMMPFSITRSTGKPENPEKISWCHLADYWFPVASALPFPRVWWYRVIKNRSRCPKSEFGFAMHRCLARLNYWSGQVIDWGRSGLIVPPLIGSSGSFFFIFYSHEHPLTTHSRQDYGSNPGYRR